MSRSLELPDDLYTALEQTAEACGLTPAAGIAAHLGRWQPRWNPIVHLIHPPQRSPVASPVGSDELAAVADSRLRSRAGTNSRIIRKPRSGQGICDSLRHRPIGGFD